MIVPIETESLGDCLAYTSLFKYKDGVVYFRKNNDAAKNSLQFLFEGLADVEFVDELPFIIKEPAIYKECISRNLLRHFKIPQENCIPKIKLGKDTKKPKCIQGYKNPIAFNPYNGLHKTTTHPLGRYRSLKEEYAESVASKLVNLGFTPIQFGISSQTQKVKKCKHIFDCDLKELASCYSHIKSYVGCDTGDYHLMLSVGGFSTVFVPKDNWNYRHIKHHYSIKDFAGEDPRVKYIYL